MIHLPTIHGDFKLYDFQDGDVAIVKEPITQSPLVRIHSSCFTSEVLGSLRCDCREQLELALCKIEQEGGILIYLQQEGRGIGLSNKIKAYQLQEQGLDTVQAQEHLGLPIDARGYEKAVAILKHFTISTIRLMTNNPRKIETIENAGIEVQRQEHAITCCVHNERYLQTKKEKLGHLL